MRTNFLVNQRWHQDIFRPALGAIELVTGVFLQTTAPLCHVYPWPVLQIYPIEPHSTQSSDNGIARVVQPSLP